MNKFLTKKREYFQSPKIFYIKQGIFLMKRPILEPQQHVTHASRKDNGIHPCAFIPCFRPRRAITRPVQQYEMADDRPPPRRPYRRGHRLPAATQRILYRCQQRWRMEIDRLWPYLVSHIRRAIHRLHRRCTGSPFQSQHLVCGQRRGPATTRFVGRQRYV